MIHIVFQPADAERLKEAIDLDEGLQGEIVVITDDFSVGPVADEEGNESFQHRKIWWDEVLEYSPYVDQTCMTDDRLAVHQLKRKLEDDDDVKVWIWMAQNAHDVCGYYWIIPQLAKYQGRIFVLYLNNLPFINEKGGIFYPDYLFEIRPSEYLKAKKLARPVTPSEFELDADEWKKLCSSNDIIRRLEGGKKITGRNAHHFDKEILQQLTESQKLNKVISAFTKNKHYISDVFIVWRIRKMAEENVLEVLGDWEKGWKEIGVIIAEEEGEE